MTFPDGKNKVITLSYDDGKIADKKLVNLFNHYGLKATFHMNGGLLDQPERIPSSEVSTLYQGHEIACHTFTHPTMARCPEMNIVEEILEDRKTLEVLAGYPVRGLSYPNGSFDQRVKSILPSLGIAYSRTVNSTGSFAMPQDLLEWNPTCHHKKNLLHLATEFFNLHKTQYLYMLYVWGHSYEFDSDDNWDVIENFSQLAEKQNDIWFATNIQIVDYLFAFQQLQFSASGDFVYNPSVQCVWLNVNQHVIEVTGGSQVKLN